MKFCERSKTEVTVLALLLAWETDHSRSALCLSRKAARRVDNLPLQHEIILWIDSQQAQVIVKTPAQEFFC